MKFGEFVKKLLIYNFTFLFIYSNLLQGDISHTSLTKSNEFKRNVLFLCEKLKINVKTLRTVEELLNANPVLVFQITLGVLFFFSFLSIITQKKVFNFFFTIIFGFLAAVFYNPMLPENRIAAPFGLRRELILSVGIFIVMCVNIFNPESDSNSKDVSQLPETENIKQTTVTDSKKKKKTK